MCNCNERQTKEWAEDMAQKVTQLTGEEQIIEEMEIDGQKIYIFRPEENHLNTTTDGSNI